MVKKLPPSATHQFELIDGERRWLACQLADVPFRAFVVSISSTAEQFLRSAVSNYHRADHTALEDARTCERLHDVLNMTWEEVAETIGRSMTWVTSQRVPLLRLDTRVQEMIEPARTKRGQISVGVAIELTKLPAEKQFPLACKVIQDEMRLADLRFEVRRIQNRTGYRPGTHRQRVPSDDYQTLTTFLKRTRRDARLYTEMLLPQFEAMFVKRSLVDRREMAREMLAAMQLMEKILLRLKGE